MIYSVWNEEKCPIEVLMKKRVDEVLSALGNF